MKLMPQGDFDKVYELMEVSFSLDEHRTYEEEKELLCRSEYEIYILPDETSDDIKAFMAVWEFDSIVYLEHFAVNPKFRNEGIGSDMIQELLRMFSKKICLEVELPEEKLAARRIEFYRRNGFSLNEFPYMQPSITQGRKSIPLRIMTSGGVVSDKEFNDIVGLLYGEVYQTSVPEKF